jgi:uncharacterized protein (TIGR03086 family)
MTRADRGRADQAGLLESAIRYALSTVQAVTPDLLSRPTPCRGWDLRMLLRHACESLAALREGADAGRVGLLPSGDACGAADPVHVFRERAGLLLGARAAPPRPRPAIVIADYPLPPDIVAATGALEIAVHGWDVSRTCGQRRPIPGALAADLLAVAPMLVPGHGRYPLFAAPVAVAPTASPSDRLAAFLGRRLQA